MADMYPGAIYIANSGFFPRQPPARTLALSAIHITATLADAAAQATYAARAGSQVTATFWVNRDGSIVQSLSDPLRQGAWANGVLNGPDLSNPRIAAIVRDGVNPNIRTLVAIENVGREPGDPITPAQVMANGRILAYYHAKLGIPVNRETVVGHYQFDRVNRPNCPSTDKSVIDRIVAAANGTAQGDSEVNITTKTYPWPRTWYTKGGSLTGYILGDDPNVTMSFAAGSPAPSSAEVAINPLPADWGWPAGPYQLVSDGPLKGCLVANSQVTLDPEPKPLPAPPTTVPQDCSQEVAAATLALRSELTDTKEQLAAAKAAELTLRSLIRSHNTTEKAMQAID